MKATFRFVKPGRHVHDETGIVLVRGINDGDIEWQVWTAGMGKPLGTAPSLNEAKTRARWVITERKEWLA